MKQLCDYHPTRVAHWTCSKCDAHLCPECVVRRDKGGHLAGELLHLCPKCNIPVDWVGVSNIIEPFWSRLPKIFTYPLQPRPLLLMVVVTVISFVFQRPGLVSLLISGAAWMVVLKYSFEVLKATAGGDLSPPKLNSQTMSEDMMPVLKQFAMYILLILGFGWVLVKLGFFLGIVYLILALLFIPAMVILVVTTNSLLHAINPVIFIQLVFRIGWGYLLMFLFLGILGSAPNVLARYVIDLVPAQMTLVLHGFAKCFYTIVSYHLMGYVILQYHEEIGFRVDFDDFKDPANAPTEAIDADPGEAILREVKPLIQEGRLDEAIAAIKAMTHGVFTSVAVSERYYKLLKMQKRLAEVVDHGVTHLDLLAKANQKDPAMKVFAECRKLDRKFQPTAEALYKIGEWFNAAGKSKEALAMYNRLVKTYPGNTLVPKAYFRAAQIFHDRLMNPDKARQILNRLMDKYPNNDIEPQVRNYMANM
jgi:hypothetical protein